MLNKAKKTVLELYNLYFNKNMFVIAALGYGSGLPFSLVFITYTFKLAESGLNLRDIGLFGLAGLPFAIKFIWSPLVDGMKIKFLHNILGQRRSWLLVSQLIIACLIARLGFVDPQANIMGVVYIAIAMSFVSATYDIAYDAIRVELLSEDKQGPGAGMSILGYRIGMLVSTGVALIIADQYSWKTAFITVALTFVLPIAATLLSSEPHRPEINLDKRSLMKWLAKYVVEPFAQFIKKHDNWVLIILFAVLYKLGDALLSKMLNPFYQQMGFSKTEVAEITKFFGFLMTIVGGMIGGWAIYKIGVVKSLVWFGILQTLSNLTYAWLAMVGHSLPVLTVVIIAENMTAAMGTAAFVAYFSSLCDRKYTATQYALLTSFMSLGRWVTNAPSGYLVDPVHGLGLSWEWFFVISTVIAIPGLVLIKFLKIKDTKTVLNLGDVD